MSAAKEETPAEIEACEVEYVEHERPILVPQIQKVVDGRVATLVSKDDGYEIQNVRRPSGNAGTDDLPTLLYSDSVPGHVLESDGGSNFTQGQVVDINWD